MNLKTLSSKVLMKKRMKNKVQFIFSLRKSTQNSITDFIARIKTGKFAGGRHLHAGYICFPVTVLFRITQCQMTISGSGVPSEKWLIESTSIQHGFKRR